MSNEDRQTLYITILIIGPDNNVTVWYRGKLLPGQKELGSHPIAVIDAEPRRLMKVFGSAKPHSLSILLDNAVVGNPKPGLENKASMTGVSADEIEDLSPSDRKVIDMELSAKH
jgi:hypothetical protein